MGTAMEPERFRSTRRGAAARTAGHEAILVAGLMPIAKVTAGGTSGAVALVLIWLAGYFKIELPAEVAAAIVLVATTLAAYIKR